MHELLRLAIDGSQTLLCTPITLLVGIHRSFSGDQL